MGSAPRSPRHYVGNFDLEEKPKPTQPAPTPGEDGRIPTPDPVLRAQRLERLEAQKKHLPAVIYIEAKAIIMGGITKLTVEPSEAQWHILHKIGVPGY